MTQHHAAVLAFCVWAPFTFTAGFLYFRETIRATRGQEDS